MNNIKIEFINNEYKYYINDTIINNKIFDEEMFDYVIKEREEIIDNLIGWISEITSESDKTLMKDDLKYLMSLKDEFIFSSISTNDYVAKSDNEPEFDEICEQLLELNAELDKIVIKFYDNEGYDYPLMECSRNELDNIKALLKEYQKNDDYNFDDFIELLKESNIQVRTITGEIQLFF